MRRAPTPRARCCATWAGRIEHAAVSRSLRASTASSSAPDTTASSVPPPWRAPVARCWCSRRSSRSAERRSTREFAPGFRVSACAHLLHLMPAALDRGAALELARPEVGGASRCRPRRCWPTARRSPMRGGSQRRGCKRLRPLLGPDGTLRAGAWCRCCPACRRAWAPMIGGIALACLGLGWRIRTSGAPRHARAAAHRRHERARSARRAVRVPGASGRARASMPCSVRTSVRARPAPY